MSCDLCDTFEVKHSEPNSNNGCVVLKLSALWQVARQSPFLLNQVLRPRFYNNDRVLLHEPLVEMNIVL